MFFYLTNKKKWQGMMNEAIVGYEHKEWTDPIQRFRQISDFALDTIKDTYNHIYEVFSVFSLSHLTEFET